MPASFLIKEKQVCLSPGGASLYLTVDENKLTNMFGKMLLKYGKIVHIHSGIFKDVDNKHTSGIVFWPVLCLGVVLSLIHISEPTRPY